MKKHNFEQAISIFKGMFKGWSVVTKTNERYELAGVDVLEGNIMNHDKTFEFCDISHLEQTIPMNGDEVWVWDNISDGRSNRIYIGKSTDGLHVCSGKENSGLSIWSNVELITPVRTLTIAEVTEMLKRGEQVNEPFEIVK